MTLSLIGQNDDPPDPPEADICEVCQLAEGGCVCPRCPFCGETGRLACYSAGDGFSLPLTRPQAVARIRARARAYNEACIRDVQYADWLESSPDAEVSPHLDDYPTTI